MKVVLMGYMGSGKSTIGKLLAKELNIPFIDLDSFIEDKEQMTVKQLFSDKSEIYFRKIENKYLKEVLDSNKDFILALGGGTPCYANNIDIIIHKSKSIYLKGSIQTLYNRLEASKEERPLIAAIEESNLKEFIAKHLFERNRFYEQAKQIVQIDGKEIEEVIKEINSNIL